MKKFESKEMLLESFTWDLLERSNISSYGMAQIIASTMVEFVPHDNINVWIIDDYGYYSESSHI